MIDVLEQQIKERVLDSAALTFKSGHISTQFHDPLDASNHSFALHRWLPWQQVANNIGGGISADHARILLNRYLAANAG